MTLPVKAKFLNSSRREKACFVGRESEMSMVGS
jgi:hypothetical protein